MAIRATVHDVEQVGDDYDDHAFRFVTLGVGDASFAARDTRRLVDPDWVGTERAVVVMAFFPSIEAAGGDEASTDNSAAEMPAGIDASADRVAFSGTVTDIEAGEEGFVGTLDVGEGTVRFDPGGTPDVRPGDRVTVTSETIHVVAVEE